LAYTTTDAFAFENCTYQIVDRKARPAPKPEICTLDADFHSILAVAGAASPSVVRIRQQGLRGADGHWISAISSAR
jgi:hypothetical protein